MYVFYYIYILVTKKGKRKVNIYGDIQTEKQITYHHDMEWRRNLNMDMFIYYTD